MRVLLLADIHGNRAALDVAVRALQRAGVDEWISAGDAVGYGPDPNEVIDCLDDLGARAVAGNHELLLRGELSSDTFVERARTSLSWTRAALTDRSWSYVRDLPLRLAVVDVTIAHGSLDDATRYVTRRRQAARQLMHPEFVLSATRWLVLGHTHQQLMVSDRARRFPILPGRERRLDPARRYVLNPGSVGQSRQFETRPRVRFMLLDTARLTATWFVMPYDDASTRRRLFALGMRPEWVHVRPSLTSLVRRSIRSWLT